MDLVGRSLGKYQIAGRLGAGGMGVVYRAFHPGLEIYVALKVLSADAAEDPTALARFRRESQVLAKLRHPGIVAVQDSDSSDGLPFYVMPLIDDPTLEAELEAYHARAEEFPVARAIRVTVSLLEVLEAVHRADVIHRDIKPANVFVDADGRAMLTDFGLARGGTEVGLTRTGAAVGTILWMAPEQLEGGELDARTDLYQTGLMLYRMLEGRLPFDGDITNIVKVKCMAAALPVSTRGGLPAALSAVLEKLTARKPEHRYPDAKSAREALSAIGQPSRAGQPRVGQPRVRPVSRVPAPTRTVDVVPPRLTGRTVAGALAAVLAAGLTLGGIRAAKRRSHQTPAPSASAAAELAPSASAAPELVPSASAAPELAPSAPELAPSASAAAPSTPSRSDTASPAPAWRYRRPRDSRWVAGSGLHWIGVTWPGARTPAAGAEMDSLFALGRKTPDADARAIAVVRAIRAHIPPDVRAALPTMKLHFEGSSALAALGLRDPVDATEAWAAAAALRKLDELTQEAQDVLVRARGGQRVGLRRGLGLKLEGLVTYMSLLYPQFQPAVAEPGRREVQGMLTESTESMRELFNNNRLALEVLDHLDARVRALLVPKR